jgi:hypothetical protein
MLLVFTCMIVYTDAFHLIICVTHVSTIRMSIYMFIEHCPLFWDVFIECFLCCSAVIRGVVFILIMRRSTGYVHCCCMICNCLSMKYGFGYLFMLHFVGYCVGHS